jgi:hypothetical protein
VETIRKAIARLNPEAPPFHRSTRTKAPSNKSPAPLTKRARMLQGCSIYVSGAPCRCA